MKKGSRSVKLALLALMPFVILEIALRILGVGGSIIYDENDVCGYRPRPNQTFSTLGNRITISEDGYREPVTDNGVLFVGDSVTYGCAFVPSEDVFTARIGGANAGVNGWGVQNVSRYLVNADLSDFRHVFWIIPSADVLRPYMTLRGGLISTNRRMWLRLEYLVRFIWYGMIVRQPDYQDDSAFEPNVEAIRTAYESVVRDRGLKLYIILLPYKEEVLGRETRETPYTEKLIAALEDMGIPHRLLKPEGNLDAMYKDNCHLTSEGNAWLAEQIEKNFPEYKER